MYAQSPALQRPWPSVTPSFLSSTSSSLMVLSYQHWMRWKSFPSSRQGGGFPLLSMMEYRVPDLPSCRKHQFIRQTIFKKCFQTLGNGQCRIVIPSRKATTEMSPKIALAFCLETLSRWWNKRYPSRASGLSELRGGQSSWDLPDRVSERREPCRESPPEVSTGVPLNLWLST